MALENSPRTVPEQLRNSPRTAPEQPRSSIKKPKAKSQKPSTKYQVPSTELSHPRAHHAGQRDGETANRAQKAHRNGRLVGQRHVRKAMSGGPEHQQDDAQEGNREKERNDPGSQPDSGA